MKFIGRKEELNTLEKEFRRDGSFVVIYGRRRIGKTTLIKEFIKDKQAFYFLATEEVESQSMKRLAGVVARVIGNSMLQRAKIALHYPAVEREAVWEKVQRQYADFLSDWRTDLGGKRNFHNGVGGTYDCIAIMSYYVVCKAITSFREIEEMEENLILPTFRKLKFVDCNKPFWRKLMYRAFVRAKSGCDKWHDYEMSVAPYETDNPIYYEFTSCPAAEFAIKHGLTDIMPALCNVDFASMELLHARLIRTNTCVNGCRCDYTICGDQDPYVKEHPEYRDEAGFRRNR